MSIICVYAACLRPSCASTVEADSVEKHDGLAASAEWAGAGAGASGSFPPTYISSSRTGFNAEDRNWP